ncbi:limulus clotting factor C-like [Pomacea canaliculata]|uniref:limulus clotting factor C-like n=1 Tax=Pomacea canaliculata TaxID=400727 RepID=UPI000D72CBEA|nr:limulus clotting factor C-like [Pomacea canaliculata]
MATTKRAVMLGVVLVGLLNSVGTSNSSFVLRKRRTDADVMLDQLGSKLCPQENVVCHCGTDMATSVVQARQCRVYTQWGATCEPCPKQQVCKRLKDCLRCQANNPAGICAECHPGRYGNNCQDELPCRLPEIKPPMNIAIISRKRRAKSKHPDKVTFKAQFSCQDGATLNGTRVSRCLPNGQWNKPFPTCELCAMEPRHIEGARVKEHTPGYVVYECDLGFMAEKGKPSQAILRCNNGEWIGDIIECIPRARCLEVPIFHGARQVEAHSQVSGSYFEDDRLVFQCEQPSSTPRSFIFTCKNGRWQGETPTCEMAGCARFELEDANVSLENSDGEWNTAPVGATVQIHCGGGRLPHPSSGLVTCTQNGRWEPPAPQCISLHGSCQNRCRLTKSEDVEITPDWSEILPGQTVKYTCKEGSFRQGPEERICLCNGTLTGTETSCSRIRTCNITHIREPLKFCRGLHCSSKSKNGCKQETYIPTYEIPEGLVLDQTVIEFYCEDEERYELKESFRAQCLPDKGPIQVPSCRPRCGQRFPDKKPRVQGGHSTKVNEWPWQAAIQEGDRTVCGAALVSDKWVITAAHCVTEVNSTTPKSPRAVRVVYGATKMDEFRQNAQVIQKIHVHDDYNPRDYTHDLALLELSAVALMSKRVGLVCLPTSTECTQKRFSSGTRGIVTGWGRMGEGLFPELQELNMTVIEGEPCRDYFIQQGYTMADRLSQDTFCSISDDSTQNAVEGDSGSPFVVQVENTWVLEGLVSFGHSDEFDTNPKETTKSRACNSDKCYTGFTRVSSYLPWIYDKLGIIADADRCVH